MTWFAHIEGQRFLLAPGLTYTVGRDAQCDIVVRSSSRVSREHLTVRIFNDDGGWDVKDVSTNGSATSTGVFKSRRGQGDLVLQLGGPQGPTLILSQDRNADPSSYPAAKWPAKANPVGKSGSVGIANVTRFGRAHDNDVVIENLLASPHHAHVLKEGITLTVVDLASARGTFVNGARVQRQELKAGDIVSMGGQSFTVTQDGTVTPVKLTTGIPMSIRGVTVQADSLTLLNDINLDIPARSLVAVVGPSGSGKSTLLGALTGLRPATHGTVLLNGQDLYASYADWRYGIGFVPQQDLVPPQLSVREALTYAAQLRFPGDTSPSERSQRINEVLRELKLQDRADLRIDRLSGGQRKRVSVALELLTKPPILYLDEPTSGLDPGLDQQLMMLLRELADDGRTVVVVTHAMDNLSLCDRVLVLAAGGHVAYFGPPESAPGYFGADDWPGVFLALERRSGREWDQRRKELGRNTETPKPSSTGATGRTLAAVRTESGLRQLPTLIRRTWRVTVSDRAYLGLLITLPLVLAALGFLVGNEFGLGRGEAPDGVNDDARILLLILILGATFTGGATSIQEIVKDRVIYQRERAVGLSRVAYVLSKAIVLGAIAAAQGAVFAALTLAGRPGPDQSLVLGWGTADVIVIVTLLAFTSCMLGLALSAVLPSRESTLPVLVIVTMLQVVLSGAIPLRWEAIDDVLGIVIPAAWAFTALAAITDLDQLLGPFAEQDWASTPEVIWSSVAMLTAMAMIFIMAAIALLRRSDPGRR